MEASAVIVVLLLSFPHQVRSTYEAMFRKACPYNKFCTVNSSSLPLIRTGSIPCCLDCFCDEFCKGYGDCCPDMTMDTNKQLNHSETLLTCKPILLENKATEKIFVDVGSILHIQIIDFCPVAFKSDPTIRDRCLGNASLHLVRDYDDVAIVSDQNSRVFRNKYCALCHNAESTTRWDIIVSTCLDSLDQAQLVLSEVIHYILTYCIIQHVRPDHVPLNSRTMDCNRRTCSRHMTSELSVLNGCFDGPSMPYLDIDIRRPTIVYKNVFCYKCSTTKNEETVCPKEYPNIGRGLNKRSLRVLLYQGYEDNVRPANPVCAEAELYDTITGKCRRLYCPPFEASNYGRCRLIINGMNTIQVLLQIVFTFHDEVIAIDDLKEYDENASNTHLKIIRDEFALPRCHTASVHFDYIVEQDDKSKPFLLLRLDIQTGQNCSLRYIQRQMRKRSMENIEETLNLSGKYFKMEGRYTFFDVDHFYPTADRKGKYEKKKLMSYYYPGDQVFILSRFFICPYFLYDITEFNEHIARSISERGNGTISKFAVTTVTPGGYYTISEQKVALCLKTNQGKNLAESIESTPLSRLIIAVILAGQWF